MGIERIQQRALEAGNREWRSYRGLTNTIRAAVLAALDEYKQQTTGVLTDEQVEAGARAAAVSVYPRDNYDNCSDGTKDHYRRLVRAAAPHVQYTAPAPARVESTAPVQDAQVVREMYDAWQAYTGDTRSSMIAALAVARKHESERWQKAITEECESRFHRDFSTPSYLAAILRRLTPQPPEDKRVRIEREHDRKLHVCVDGEIAVTVYAGPYGEKAMWKAAEQYATELRAALDALGEGK